MSLKQRLQAQPIIILAFGGLAIGVLWGLMPLIFGGNAQACAAVPANTGRETFQINAPTSGKYAVWSRVNTPSASANSYYLQVDSACAIRIGHRAIPVNSYTWVNYHDANPKSKTIVSLSSGKHTIRAIGAETGFRLDRVLFTTDLKCVPKGLGENCASLNNPKPPANPYACPKHPVVQLGSQGDCVKRAQWFVNHKHKAGLQIDGDFGPATEKAVKRYQSVRNLTVDGVIGPQTWKSLEE